MTNGLRVRSVAVLRRDERETEAEASDHLGNNCLDPEETCIDLDPRSNGGGGEKGLDCRYGRWS